MAQKFLTDIELTRGLKDSSGDLGTSGQVLSSTGSALNWVDNTASASVVYQDGFTGDGSTTAFTLANSIDSENKTQVYIDGVYQHKDTYSLSGTTLTFSTAPPNTSDIEVISFKTVTADGDILTDSEFSSAGLMKTNGSGVYSIVTDNSSNWNTAYTYSQVGHLPLAGGTLTGAVVGTSFSAPSGFINGSNGGIRIHVSGTKFFNITAANAARDNIMDIGASDARFKDLYLGGNIQAAGNVGIGITSPTQKLDVVGSGGDTNIRVYDSSANSEVGIKLQGDAKTWTLQNWGSGGDNLRLLNNAGNIVQLWDDNGNVMIGNANDPAVNLHIASSTPKLRLEDTDGGYAEFAANNTDLVIKVDPDDAVGSSTIQWEIDGSEYMRLQQQGRLGIGTTSPSHILHVVSAGNGEIKAERTSGAAILTQAQSALGRFGTTTNHNLQLMTNSNTGLTINTSGGVGIGTTSPATKLHVETTASQIARFSYNSTNYQDLTYEGSNIVGGSHVFKIAGSEKMRLDTSGNLGIGTTSADQTGYGYKVLTIMGGTTAGYAGTIELLAPSVNAEGQNYGLVSFGAGGTRTALISANRESANNAGNLRFWTSSGSGVVERIRVRSSGTVGIGSAGFDSQMLTIAAGTLDGAIYATSTDANCFASFRDNSSTANIEFGAIGNSHVFRKDATEYMRLDASGNLGIGTTSPTAKLTIDNGSSSGGTLLTSSSSSYTAHFIANTGTGSAGIYCDASNGDFVGSDYAFIGQTDDKWAEIRTYSSAEGIRFAPRDSVKMVINNSGNVGIGTTSPSAAFQVGSGSANVLQKIWGSGTAGVQIFTNSPSTGTKIIALEQYFSNEGYLGLYYNGTEKVRFRSNDSSYINGGNLGIGTTSPNQKLDVAGSISSGGGNEATSVTHDTSGNVRAFVHNFSRNKDTSAASNVTLVDISGLGNFHQAMFFVEYGTRLQGVSDAVTGAVVRTYGVNRFNGGTLTLTETQTIAGSSNSVTHALVNVEIVSNTQYRLRIEFSSTLGASSFATGSIRGYAVGDAFPTITFAEGTAGE